MLRLLLLLLAAAFAWGAWTAHHPGANLRLPRGPAARHPGVAMPNPRLTPGATVAGVTARRLCRQGGAAPAGVPAALRRQVLASYGIPAGRARAYRIDHLIPVELGGAGTLANLWPQPLASAATKDRLERWLRHQTCSGRLPLATAQRRLAGDWYRAWVAAGRP
jgi:hypothetical protein